MCVGVLPAFIFVHYVCASTHKGQKSPGTGGTYDVKSPCGCFKTVSFVQCVYIRKLILGFIAQNGSRHLMPFFTNTFTFL